MTVFEEVVYPRGIGHVGWRLVVRETAVEVSVEISNGAYLVDILRRSRRGRIEQPAVHP